MRVVFYNPYSTPDVKGASRRNTILSSILEKEGISFLHVDAETIKTNLGPLALLLQIPGLVRILHFMGAYRYLRQPDTVVVSEVIFSPVWRRNFILTVHDLKVFNKDATRGGLLRTWSYYVFVRLAHRVITVSNATAEDLTCHCSVSPGRIRVVPNGLEEARIQKALDVVKPVEPQYDFVYVSSFARHKRQAQLVRALPVGSSLALVGRDMGFLDEVRREVARRVGEISVDILTNIETDNQLFHVLGAAKCGVFPSVFEGFGIPILEYALFGLTTVTTDIPPFRELKEYIDLMVPCDDDEALRGALAEAISRRSEGEARRDQLQKGAYVEGAIKEAFLSAIQVEP